jgi:hypothetical protein
VAFPEPTGGWLSGKVFIAAAKPVVRLASNWLTGRRRRRGYVVRHVYTPACRLLHEMILAFPQHQPSQRELRTLYERNQYHLDEADRGHVYAAAYLPIDESDLLRAYRTLMASLRKKRGQVI